MRLEAEGSAAMLKWRRCHICRYETLTENSSNYPENPSAGAILCHIPLDPKEASHHTYLI